MASLLIQYLNNKIDCDEGPSLETLIDIYRLGIVSRVLRTIYNMNGGVVSHIQARVEGELRYVLYNTDANVVSGLLKSSILWTCWRSNFENTFHVKRENQS